MVDIKMVLYPNKFKIFLCLMLFIPCLTVIIVILGPTYAYSKVFLYFSSIILNDPIFIISIFLGFILSYILGCSIDNYIENKNLKIFIAVLSGIISLIIIYALYKMVTDPVICDPVHMPQNHTICDPVHKNAQGNIYNLDILKDINVDSQSIKDSYQQCINNLGNK
ncbi:hypothetical protein [Methanobacterium spitsbergense]|uniref:Uncharacterized protein n=1 Tax=Methanobacterium spitsbergense TaxID=2874285 RepID=A0A8T5UL48_9EURY|nr:hypothetical protein [Methanobacterium spitsbergense]MBZ2164562.1 hypothetical protein [Methanobacterium spitsbergense]